MVVGDGRPFIGALITLDERVPGPLGRGARQGRGSTAATLPHDPELVAEIQRAVDDGQRRGVARPSRYEVPHPRRAQFTEEAGHLTPSLKLKRNVVAKDFADEIEALYQS